MYNKKEIKSFLNQSKPHGVSRAPICSNVDSKIGESQRGTVLYTEGWVCDVALIEYTLGPGKPKKGWDFRREGTRGQWGTKGV